MKEQTADLDLKQREIFGPVIKPKRKLLFKWPNKHQLSDLGRVSLALLFILNLVLKEIV
jgi:hypothetical protein